MNRCEDDNGRDSRGQESLLQLAELDRLEGDIFQETFPEKVTTTAAKNVDAAPLMAPIKRHDRLMRPRIMDISYIDRLESTLPIH